MQQRSDREPRPSPFDQFVLDFLTEIDRMEDGFVPGSGRSVIAEALEWPAEFAEAVFTSAKMRGFIENYRGRGRTVRPRWHVSQRGRSWLETVDRRDLSIHTSTTTKESLEE